MKTRLLVRKRVRFIESKQPIRLDDGTEAYENCTNSSWRNYILVVHRIDKAMPCLYTHSI